MQDNKTDKFSAEEYFLDGPKSRFAELKFAFSVLFEFIKGFRAFHFLGPCATVYGSARFEEGHEFYEKGREMGRALSELGLTVMTGGGPGIMEAANRGAKEFGGRAVGCNIQLPSEQKPNPYLDKWILINYFFVRKVLLSKYSYAFIVMPGGYGTLDEFFESIVLIQTKKSKSFPVILFGKEFHKDLIEHIEKMCKAGTISEADKKLFLITNDVNEAKAHVKKFAIDAFNLKHKRVMKPTLLLNEKE